jgi:hypothetical protein
VNDEGPLQPLPGHATWRRSLSSRSHPVSYRSGSIS